MRPDGALALGCVARGEVRRRAVAVRIRDRGGGAQAGRRWVRIGHVLDRDDDPQLHLLHIGWRSDRHRPGAAQERGDLLRRPHGGRQPDPLRRAGPFRTGLARAWLILSGAVPERVQPFQGDGQVGAALVAGQRVHLIHDDGLHPAQRVPCLGSQDEEQRLRRGDQDVRRLGRKPTPLVGAGVAGAHRHPDVRLAQPPALRNLTHPGQRRPQVALDVHGQRLQRGDVQHPAAQLRVGRGRAAGQPVQCPQERRQGLARPGRRDHQGVLAARDRRPRTRLRGRGLGERAGEPLPGQRAESGQGVHARLGASRAGAVRRARGRCASGPGLRGHASILPRPADNSARPPALRLK